MKFVCDKCNTRYSIADERVRGRVLKIRCKACNHVITVREESHPSLNDAPPGGDEHTMVSTAPPPAREDAADEWYVSFDGEQEGPLPLLRAIDRVRAERPSGKECYCWRAGFFVWLPVEDVPDFAPVLQLAKPLPPPPVPAAALKSPSGSMGAVKSPSGSMGAVKSPSGSQPALGRSTGSHSVGRSTGPAAALGTKSPTGSQPIGKSTGPVPTSTGPFAKSDAGRSTGPHGANVLPAPAFDLPGFDSGPLGVGAPSEMPSLPTKPEPRVARRDEAHATSMAVTDIEAPPASPFAAALKATGAPPLPDTGQTVAPKGEVPRIDTGPVPLPPPPGDELPIGEASGLISLSHLSKAVLPTKPSQPAKPIETFGGVPVTPSANHQVPSGIVATPGAAPGSAPAWMKWAALAGGLGTLALAAVVGVLLSRKPTVIVVPPAPQLHNDNNPILLADPGPSSAGGPASASAGNESESHRSGGNHQRARAAKPSSKSDEKLTGDQGKLAALYRNDEGEHAVKGDARLSERGGGGGQVSQQAILAVVAQNKRSLNLCYDRVLKHDSSLKSGRVVTHVKIGISGSVTGVSVPDPQYSTSEIGQCIAQTIKHWHFPSADAEYETEFPIILQAN